MRTPSGKNCILLSIHCSIMQSIMWVGNVKMMMMMHHQCFIQQTSPQGLHNEMSQCWLFLLPFIIYDSWMQEMFKEKKVLVGNCWCCMSSIVTMSDHAATTALLQHLHHGEIWLACCSKQQQQQHYGLAHHSCQQQYSGKHSQQQVLGLQLTNDAYDDFTYDDLCYNSHYSSFLAPTILSQHQHWSWCPSSMMLFYSTTNATSLSSPPSSGHNLINVSHQHLTDWSFLFAFEHDGIIGNFTSLIFMEFCPIIHQERSQWHKSSMKCLLGNHGQWWEDDIYPMTNTTRRCSKADIDLYHAILHILILFLHYGRVVRT